MHMSPSLRLAAAAAALLVLAGCASSNRRAPVEDRAKPAPVAGAVNAPAAPTAVKAAPGAENAGKPGYHTVKPGDTLIRIALDAGQNWRDIASWNGLDNPNRIEVDQVLRTAPPVGETTVAGVSTKPVTSPKIEARGLDTKATGKPAAAAVPTPGAATSGPAASTAPATGTGTGASVASPAPTATAPAAPAAEAKDVDEPNWAWPASGAVVGGFEEGKHKGLTLAGKAGDPVLASADGRVVYAGSGLRGYGNLVILKHSGDFLTAYAHNQTLLVKEDQVVRRGQKIAEMGSTDTDRVQLHFEIRKGGKPVDPARQLPSR